MNEIKARCHCLNKEQKDLNSSNLKVKIDGISCNVLAVLREDKSDILTHFLINIANGKICWYPSYVFAVEDKRVPESWTVRKLEKIK